MTEEDHSPKDVVISINSINRPSPVEKRREVVHYVQTFDKVDNISAPAILQRPLPAFKSSEVSSSKILWSNDVENTVRTIIRNSKKLHHVHQKMALRYTNRHFYMMLSLIILGPVSSTLSIVSILEVQYPVIYNTVSALSSFASGILASVLKFSKYDEVSLSHKVAASRYIALCNNALTQLSLKKVDRASATKFLDWLTATYDELYETSPLVSFDLLESKGKLGSLRIEKETVTVSSSDRDRDTSEETTSLKKDFTSSSLSDLDSNLDAIMKYQVERLERT